MNITTNFEFFQRNQLILLVFECNGDYYLMIRDTGCNRDAWYPKNVVISLVGEYGTDASHRSVWYCLVAQAREKATELGLMGDRNLVSMLEQARVKDLAEAN